MSGLTLDGAVQLQTTLREVTRMPQVSRTGRAFKYIVLVLTIPGPQLNQENVYRG
jgi:hypothetical protein